MATQTSTSAGKSSAVAEPAAGRAGRGGSSRGGRRRSRPVQYYREIVSELRKVIYPSRQELVTYVIVVVVFVSFITAVVASLDFGLTKAVLAVFG